MTFPSLALNLEQAFVQTSKIESKISPNKNLNKKVWVLILEWTYEAVGLKKKKKKKSEIYNWNETTANKGSAQHHFISSKLKKKKKKISIYNFIVNFIGYRVFFFSLFKCFSFFFTLGIRVLYKTSGCLIARLPEEVDRTPIACLHLPYRRYSFIYTEMNMTCRYSQFFFVSVLT